MKNHYCQNVGETRLFKNIFAIFSEWAYIAEVGISDTRKYIPSKKFHPSRYFVSESATAVRKSKNYVRTLPLYSPGIETRGPGVPFPPFFTAICAQEM